MRRGLSRHMGLGTCMEQAVSNHHWAVLEKQGMALSPKADGDLGMKRSRKQNESGALVELLFIVELPLQELNSASSDTGRAWVSGD